jgi:cell wall-associated NlpC family hydrolase
MKTRLCLPRRFPWLWLPIAGLLLLLAGCSSKPATRPIEVADPIGQLLESPQPTVSPTRTKPSLARMGYSVQVGAFASLENAVRFERMLDQRGIDAFYFRHESGLFKVRFGNHADYQSARQQAEQLSYKGLIDNFFIVFPESYSISRSPENNRDGLRDELVKTARRFIGIPYRWGGTDQAKGFDCSGLTMVCYRLNGLNLPRVSRNQFKAGRWVAKDKLVKGDLVFFATNGGQRVSHVGMYIGDGRFIHAPRTGKTVRIEKLSNSFFTRTYMGGRSYL